MTEPYNLTGFYCIFYTETPLKHIIPAKNRPIMKCHVSDVTEAKLTT